MNHPNKLPWEGVLTLVDQESDMAPSGGRGHRVILTARAAMAALGSLRGMAVCFKVGWDGHNARQKCGVIEQAWLEGQELKVNGYVYGRDFPEIATQIREGGRLSKAMGMSYELADAHVDDMSAKIWTITDATFTGAAILLRSQAAYKRTSFRLIPVALELAASGVTMNGLKESGLE